MKKEIRPLTWIEIDLAALNYNLRQIRKKVKGVGILAVVKSDAYGHGAKEVARLLSKNKVEMLGVATVAEAQDLREAGIKIPIAILSGILPEQIEAAIDCQVIPTVSDWKLTQSLNQIGKKRRKKINIQVKVDTGMGRFGIWHTEALGLIRKIKKLGFLSLQGIFTHFVAADEKDKTFTKLQLKRFKGVIRQLEKTGIHIPWKHAANSAAILGVSESYFNMVRPGLILYGSYPSTEIPHSISLKPVMTLKSRLIALKKIPRGQSVSYGRTWRAKTDTTAGILPLGYSMGYSRFLSNCGEVIVKGKKIPVIGRVCMDLILVDLGYEPKARVGDEVILIGKKGNQIIAAGDLSQKIGTIPYEILCLLGNRLPRVHLS